LIWLYIKEKIMKTTLLQLLGCCWIALVLYLYVAQSQRFRPSGAFGDLIRTFFDSMTAAYLQ